MICFKIFSNPYHRKKHEEDKHKEPEFNCRVCSEKFQYEKSLNKHIDDFHTEVKTHSCKLCGKILSTEAILKRHQDTFHGKPSHCCNHCGEKFTQKCNYERHLQEVHGFSNKLNAMSVKANSLVNTTYRDIRKLSMVFRRKPSRVLFATRYLTENLL